MTLKQIVSTRITTGICRQAQMNLREGHQPRAYIMKNEKGAVLPYCQYILNSRRITFVVLNVRGFNDDEQTHIQTAEPLLPECSVFEVEMAIENLKDRPINHRELIKYQQY
jgi:hypothetical protein